ncbi:hypothetical protein ABIF81_003298 [Bradyrhizobium daqingense]
MNILSSLFAQSADGRHGVLMSALAGIAAALAVALAMTVYFRLSYRTWREVARHGLATLAAILLFGFAAYDMRHAALAYLGLNPSKPAVEFEIRMPREMLTGVVLPHISMLPGAISCLIYFAPGLS